MESIEKLADEAVEITEIIEQLKPMIKELLHDHDIKTIGTAFALCGTKMLEN